MKKVLSVIALAALAGCTSYDYYEGGVRYTQDGPDCIYYSGEYGSRFSNDIHSLNGSKRVVYRNTICADLYARDNFNQAPRADRVILAPAAAPVMPCTTCGGGVHVHKADCGCSQPKQMYQSRYVVVPAM